MKLASLNTGDPDGRLLVVSRDLSVAVDAGFIAPSISRALERWDEVAPRLEVLARAIDAGAHPSVFPFDPTACSTIQDVSLSGRLLTQQVHAAATPPPFYSFW
ncbi:hypothetical protein LJR289_000899 [Pseudoduganella sp. LjRoot289]|uniref:hypothetical protein n=1 Tax=Pseudoduganella sp. LjRoot289 TaxID=3342314 RepID=UPI003ED0523B